MDGLNAVRHYVFALGGLIVLGIVAGSGTALAVAVALLASIGTHGLTGVIGRLESWFGRLTLPLMGATTFGSLAVAVVGAVVLFVRVGWLSSVGLAVLLIGYWVLMESSADREQRVVDRGRGRAHQHLVQRADGAITEEQLQARLVVTLRRDMPESAYASKWLYERLLARGSLSAEQHRHFLTLLDRFLAGEDDPFRRYRDLRAEIRDRIASGG